MSKTINQALKDLYLSLGGDPSALTDNSTVSDYIADLENGLKGLAELPAPSSDNSGKIAKVVSDGEGGYIWGAENETQELPAVESTDINKLVGVVSDGASGAEYGLVSAPTPESDIYTLEATYENYALTFAEGEAERLVNAITAGKTILCKIKGLSGYTTSGDILTVANVQTPFSSSWGSMLAEAVATKGAGASTQIFMISFYIMCSSGTLSGTGGIWQLAQAST